MDFNALVCGLGVEEDFILLCVETIGMFSISNNFILFMVNFSLDFGALGLKDLGG